ncbi:MAG: PilW family protein [Lachnospirales bacterium]
MKKKKGITLVELLVGMAITGILLGFVGTTIVTNMKLFYKAEESNQAQIVTTDIFSSLEYYFASDANRSVSIVDTLPEPADYRHNVDYIYMSAPDANGMSYLTLMEFSKREIDPVTGLYLSSTGADITNEVGTLESTSKLCMQGANNFTYNFIVDLTQDKFLDMKVVADVYPNGYENYEKHIYFRKNTSVDVVNTLETGQIIKITNVAHKVLTRN